MVRLNTLLWLLPVGYFCTSATAQMQAVGSLAQVVSGGGWTTTITVQNNGTAATGVHLQFYSDAGTTPVLPFTFPQGGSPVSGGGLDATIAPGAEWLVRTTGPASQAPAAGWAQLYGNSAITGSAVLSYVSGASLSEAVVPLETRNPSKFFMPFDFTGGYVTGVAVANLSTSAATIPITVRDDGGRMLATGSLQLAGNAHTAFVPTDSYKAAVNQRGMMEIDTPTGGQLSVLGLSFNPTLVFTSIPAVATGAAASSATGPVITGVSALSAQQTQTITITGSGFGTQAAYNGDSSFLEITDQASNWNAGLSNSSGSNTVNLNVTSWTDTSIVLSGFTGSYGCCGYVLNNGDSVQVKVWNAQSQTGPAIYTTTVGQAAVAASATLSISTSSLSSGTVGTTFSQTLSATGGTPPYSWSVSSGSLPAGLTLSPAGVLSGTLTTAGTYSFMVQVTDSLGAQATMSLSMAVAQAGSGSTPGTIVILPPTLSPTTIEPGMSATLSWSSTCSSVSISPGIGSVASAGSVQLRPTSTTQYIIYYGGNCNSQDTKTVTVVPVATINSFTANPATIAPGGTATLSWTTSNVNYLDLTPYPHVNGIPFTSSQNYASGSVQVSPTTTTTYTLTADDLIDTSGLVNPGVPIPLGTKVTKTVTVTVGTSGSGGSGGSGGGGGGGSNPPGSGGGVYTGSGTVITPTGANCISIFYNSAYFNFLAFRNTCSQSIYFGWGWSNPPYGLDGGGDLAAGAVSQNGYLQSEVNTHGGLIIVACPSGYYMVDSSGNPSSNPHLTYWCRKQGT